MHIMLGTKFIEYRRQKLPKLRLGLLMDISVTNQWELECFCIQNFQKQIIYPLCQI